MLVEGLAVGVEDHHRGVDLRGLRQPLLHDAGHLTDLLLADLVHHVADRGHVAVPHDEELLERERLTGPQLLGRGAVERSGEGGGEEQDEGSSVAASASVKPVRRVIESSGSVMPLMNPYDTPSPLVAERG
ncbi:MAG: hypothetical protein H6730_17580 [Deltaproteobacteria bacterium]|nr:hypothetical protein [Deltaproteobacteria bacterium]